jgi:class 3 adenylate cyclase
MGEASAGEIHVTGSLEDRLHGSRFEFRDTGEHTLKGFTTPR